MATLRDLVRYNLRRMLREQGLSQKEFADMLLVNCERVSRWLSGGNFPRDHQIDNMRAVLNCTHYDLIAPIGGAKVQKADQAPSKPIAEKDDGVKIVINVEELAKLIGYDIVRRPK